MSQDIDEAIGFLAVFRQGGAWDFQRVGTPFVNVPAFQDYANVEIGAYAAAIGVPLSSILTTADEYAATHSTFAPGTKMDSTYVNLPAGKVWDITHGYQWYNSGVIGHH